MTTTMNFRQLRWFVTLYRHGVQGNACPATAWRRRRRRAMLAACLLLAAGQARAATLRAYSQIAAPTVHLSDLFENLGPAPDRVLGAAPAPGETITVQAAQLAAIARDYGVDWRPESGSERIVLRRRGVRLAQEAFLPQLLAALAEQGAPADGDVSLPGFDAPMLPVGATPEATITDSHFDPASGRFTARLSVALADGPAIVAQLGGQVQSVVQAAVLTHPVRPGTVLLAQDLRAARVHAGLLRGNVPISPEAALGQALRHAMPPGEPLTASDVSRPILVARNSAVHMRLDAGVINLSAQGVALEDGGIGETVRVQNPSSRVVVMASVVGAGEVRVVPQSASLEVAAQ